MQAYVLLRPTPQSQDSLVKLIQRNLFKEYHVGAPLPLCFPCIHKLARHRNLLKTGTTQWRTLCSTMNCACSIEDSPSRLARPAQKPKGAET